MCIQCLVQVPDPWEGVEKRGEGKKMKGVRMGKGKENGEGEGWREGNEKRTFPERTNDIDKFPIRVTGEQAGGRTAAEERER